MNPAPAEWRIATAIDSAGSRETCEEGIKRPYRIIVNLNIKSLTTKVATKVKLTHIYGIGPGTIGVVVSQRQRDPQNGPESRRDEESLSDVQVPSAEHRSVRCRVCDAVIPENYGTTFGSAACHDSQQVDEGAWATAISQRDEVVRKAFLHEPPHTGIPQRKPSLGMVSPCQKSGFVYTLCTAPKSIVSQACGTAVAHAERCLCYDISRKEN